jgi:hypothetical protein
MKMIFESILLDKVQEQISIEKEKIRIDKNDEGYIKEYEIIVASVTFEWYKVSIFFLLINFFIKKNCFNAWRFKNLVLCSDEYIIHEYQRENEVLPTLEKIAMLLLKLKDDAEKIKDKDAEKIYWPLINAVLVTVYSSIARRKLDTYNDNNDALKATVEKLEAQKNECKGKITVLNEVRGKISQSIDKENTFLQKVTKDIKSAVNGGKEGQTQVSNEEFEKTKNQIVDDSYAIIDSLKEMDSKQEDNLVNFLKALGKTLVGKKTLKDGIK